MGGVVAGYAYVFHGFHKETGVFALITIASQLLFFFGAWLVCVLAHNFRRDQSLNARIRHEFDVIGDDNIFPLSYDPALTTGRKWLLTWMPDFYGLFYAMFLAFQMVFLISYILRIGTQLPGSFSGISWPVSITVGISVVALFGSTCGGAHYHNKLLSHFRLIDRLPFWQFYGKFLWLRPRELARQTRRAEEIKRKYWHLFKLCADFSSVCTGLRDKFKPKTILEGIILYHTVRAHSLLRATAAACEEGYPSEGMVLLRSMFTIVVNMNWITQGDQSARAQRFADFEIVRRQARVDLLREIGTQLDRASPPSGPARVPGFDEIRRKYGLNTEDDLMNWSGKSTFEMAKEVGLERQWYTIDDYTRKIDETSPDAVRNYLERVGDSVRAKWDPEDEGVEFALLEAMRLFVRVMDVSMKTFGVESNRMVKLALAHIERYQDFLSRSPGNTGVGPA